MVRSASEKERDRDKRLRKTYGITLADYNRIFDAQGGKCAICGRPPKDKSLNVDHVHFHIDCHRAVGQKGWVAGVLQFDSLFVWGKTKTAAIAAAKQKFMRRSVRGLLCPGRYAGCNRKLGRLDSVPWLQAAVSYLQDPPARKVLDT